MSRSAPSDRSSLSKFPIRNALDALLAQRLSDEHVRRAELAHAQGRLDRAQRHLVRLEREFARACREIELTGAARAAYFEGAVAAARSAVLVCRAETEELRKLALTAVRRREAAEMLKARRMAECAAREARKEERELDEANQA